MAGNAEAEMEEPAMQLSRGLKIENLAGADGAHASQLFSADALAHAVSGSVGGNIAMLGTSALSQMYASFPCAVQLMEGGGRQLSTHWTSS